MTNYGDQNIASFEGYKETERGIFTAGGRQHLVMFYVVKVSEVQINVHVKKYSWMCFCFLNVYK